MGNRNALVSDWWNRQQFGYFQNRKIPASNAKMRCGWLIKRIEHICIYVCCTYVYLFIILKKVEKSGTINSIYVSTMVEWWLFLPFFSMPKMLGKDMTPTIKKRKSEVEKKEENNNKQTHHGWRRRHSLSQRAEKTQRVFVRQKFIHAFRCFHCLLTHKSHKQKRKKWPNGILLLLECKNHEI